MAKVTLVQENNDVHIALKTLMAMSGTNLTRVCKEHGLNYGETVKEMAKPKVELSFFTDMVKKINPEAKLTNDVNIVLSLDGTGIFKQENK